MITEIKLISFRRTPATQSTINVNIYDASSNKQNVINLSERRLVSTSIHEVHFRLVKLITNMNNKILCLNKMGLQRQEAFKKQLKLPTYHDSDMVPKGCLCL